jgi:Ca2+-binding RTX toxin-like protein
MIVAGMGADKLYGGPGTDTFKFNAFTSAVDTILDFALGQDVVDLHQLFVSIGYSGTDPIADHWLMLVSDSNGGTNFVVDPHNGQAAMVIVDVVGVTSTALRDGIDYWGITHTV